MVALFEEVESLMVSVGVVSGSKEEVVVGCMVGSRNAVRLVRDRGTAGWDPTEDTSIPFQLPCLGPALCPSPFAPGGDSRVRDNPGVVEGVGVADTLVGWQHWPVCCVPACQRPAVSFSGFSARLDRFR